MIRISENIMMGNHDSGARLESIGVVLVTLACCLMGCAAQYGTYPTTIYEPCSSAPTRALSDLCILNLTFTHLYLEFAADWEGVMDTMSDVGYEFWSPTLMGGTMTAPRTSDQSVYYMYANIDFANPPESLEYIQYGESIGANSIIFEYVVQFNHTTNFWLLPYPPTGRFVSMLMVLSVGFDDNNRVVYERNYYDGASVLSQIGLLKNGYGVYGNNIERPYTGWDACTRDLPIVGSEMATVMLQGANATSILFNKFFVNERPSPSPLPSAASSRHTARNGRAHQQQQQPNYGVYKSMLDMVYNGVEKAAIAVNKEAEYYHTAGRQ